MVQTTLLIPSLAVLGVLALMIMLILLYPQAREQDEIRKTWVEINDRLAAAESRWRGEVETARRNLILSQDACEERIATLIQRIDAVVAHNDEMRQTQIEYAIDKAQDRKKIYDLEKYKDILFRQIDKLTKIIKDNDLDAGTAPLDGYPTPPPNK